MREVHLSALEAKLLVHFLGVLSEELSAAGCNDFSLRTVTEDIGQMIAFVEDFNRYNHGTAEDEDGRRVTARNAAENLPDFCVVALLAHRIREQLKGPK